MGVSHNTRAGYIASAGAGDYIPGMERANKTQLRNRLSRIEGQVRGIAKMIDEDRYCIDVLTQLQAVRSALARVESEILKDHLNQCIVGAMASDNAADRRQKAAELIDLLGKSAR